MIRRLLARLIPGRAARRLRVYGPDKHPVRRERLSHAARTVIRKLQDEGFHAYTVGGAVRDLLLGIDPKDFDLATNATPEQVKPLFRRAVRLGAKLGLAIEPKTAEPIARLAPLMQNVPPARLFDEMQKLLLSGHSVETLKSLRAHGLSHGLLPLLDMILEQPLGQKFIDVALAHTDARVREGKGVSPAFLFATLLWHEVLASWTQAKARGEKPLPALFEAMDSVLSRQAERIAIPRRFEATIKEIWSLQPRFEQRAGARPFRLLEHPRFRAAYDFLALRGESGEVAGPLVEWWTRFQTESAEGRAAMLKPEEAPKKKRRPRGRGRKRAAALADAAKDTTSTDEPTSD